MKYPKALMRMSELKKMGFPEDYLREAYAKGGIAWRLSPEKYNSPIMFDTEELEKYRQNQMKIDHTIYRKGEYQWEHTQD